MNKNILELRKKFLEICNLGWVKSFRKGSTGIGYTFESLLGKSEDALCLPDYNGIEIKTHRKNSRSYVHLFNYNPIGDSSYELMRLFNAYSYPHTSNKHFNVLHAKVYCNYIKDVGKNYKFSLEVDEINRRIYLLVFSRYGIFIEKKSYWTFETLKEKLYSKLRYLAYVEADYKYQNGHEYFKYSKITFYTLKDFDCFIRLIKSSKIKVSFFISGKNENSGCINSHGASFSIKPENLNLLFTPID